MLLLPLCRRYQILPFVFLVLLLTVMSFVVSYAGEAPGATCDSSIAKDKSLLASPARGKSLHISAIPLGIKAESAVLIDADTGIVLYEKKAHVRRPNASTTKMMTAILTIEHCKMDDVITADKEVSETLFTSIHLKPGEKISVKDLLTGMIVRSANDAAVAAAKHMSGSTEAFSKLMNRKAKEIGCRDTHFVTPNGLYDKKHYSSAYDLCLIARYAFRYPIFNNIIKLHRYTLETRTLNREDLVVFNQSKFLKKYPGADGVKSGYIKQAGYCYVGSATRNGWRLISAVLKSDNAGRDTGSLMDYGFKNFKQVIVAKANEPFAAATVKGGALTKVPVVPAYDLKVVVPKKGAKVSFKTKLESVEAPVAKGKSLGKIIAIVDGRSSVSVDLMAAESVDVSAAVKTFEYIKIGAIAALCLFVGGKYGTAFAKNSSVSRSRVASVLRNFNIFGSRNS